MARTRINDSIEMECGYCGRSLDYKTTVEVNENAMDVKRVVKVTPCQACLTDMLEKATELVMEKAAKGSQNVLDDAMEAKIAKEGEKDREIDLDICYSVRPGVNETELLGEAAGVL